MFSVPTQVRFFIKQKTDRRVICFLLLFVFMKTELTFQTRLRFRDDGQASLVLIYKHYLLLHVGPFLAFLRPGFLRSTSRESRFSIPSFLSVPRKFVS